MPIKEMLPLEYNILSESDFYHFGVFDRTKFKATDVMKTIRNLIMGEKFIFNKAMNSILSILLKDIIKKRLLYQDWFEEYCKGVEISSEELAKHFLILEILTGISKWIPTIPSFMLGCSGLFCSGENSNNRSIHGRILDFPILNAYQENERIVTYRLQNYPQIWSLSMAGNPYPSITSMTSEGITFALHMKYGDTFNKNGYLIFEIILKILLESRNIEDVLKIIKLYPSISTWGLYMTFANGEMLSVDLDGDKFYYQREFLKNNNFVYVNNLHIEQNESAKLKNLLPIGNKNYCEMRRESAFEKINQGKEQEQEQEQEKEKEKEKEIEMLKILGNPLIKLASDASEWKINTITTVSIQLLTMNAIKGEVYFVAGKFPKMLFEKVYIYNNIWDKNNRNVQVKQIKNSYYHQFDPQVVRSYRNGFIHLAKAQFAFEQKELQTAYHSIQLAIEYFDQFEEKYIASFYFFVFQYIHDDKKKNLALLLQSFKDIKNKVPSFLQNHVKLFIFRIEMLLNGNSVIHADDFEDLYFKKLYTFERKLPKFAIGFLKKMTYPQIATMDVFYAYFRSSSY
ncbi:MAG: hypothetical protein HQK49_19190 [Oligoflexia bacterium]|nr:hypothetical protein [Oligoflexia bacterium]